MYTVRNGHYRTWLTKDVAGWYWTNVYAKAVFFTDKAAAERLIERSGWSKYGVKVVKAKGR